MKKYHGTMNAEEIAASMRHRARELEKEVRRLDEVANILYPTELLFRKVRQALVTQR